MTERRHKQSMSWINPEFLLYDCNSHPDHLMLSKGPSRAIRY